MQSEVQRNEKPPKDTRRFPQVWKVMTDKERSDVRFYLITNLRKSYQTIWNWANGKSKPLSILEKRAVAKACKSVGYNVDEDSLFS